MTVVLGDLRVGADIDQRRACARCVERRQRVEPIQTAARVVELLIDRRSGHFPEGCAVNSALCIRLTAS
jgi:hypothetical protein